MLPKHLALAFIGVSEVSRAALCQVCLELGCLELWNMSPPCLWQPLRGGTMLSTLISWSRHGMCKDTVSSWRELNPELFASRSLHESLSSLLYTYECLWFSESPTCDRLRTAISDRYQSRRSHNTQTSNRREDISTDVRFSPSTAINKVHRHKPNAKSRPTPKLNYQVGLRPFHKYCMNTFFSVWSTRSLNQATITHSASVWEQESAGRWSAPPREALPSSATPPFPQRHTEHPASQERQNLEFLKKSSAALFTLDI